MKREPVTIEPRRPLTRREVVELAVRQNGRCGCGSKLDALTEGVTDEHRLPLEWGGSNDLSNRELWRSPCAKAKTAKEAPQTAKVKRLAGETCTAPPRRPIPAGRPLTNPNLKKKMDGTVVRRSPA